MNEPLTQDKRHALLCSAVRAVARYGMKDVSTRRISADAGVNDAYIYRYFQDKEDLLVQAFLLENQQFMAQAIKQIDQVRQSAPRESLDKRFETVFYAAWRYLLDRPEVCRFFLYYYLSPNFAQHARAPYRRQLDELAEKVRPLFASGEEAKQSLYALFVLLNAFAVQVLNGEQPDTPETGRRVLQMTFAAVRSQMGPENTTGKAASQPL
ncbi:MAG: TetR/AcrR family transcriptional regulator [Eubacteriales bacterium]|nr:TetR/AcrR family transcriptional regulator [Eubacteriales bacterium]